MHETVVLHQIKQHVYQQNADCYQHSRLLLAILSPGRWDKLSNF